MDPWLGLVIIRRLVIEERNIPTITPASTNATGFPPADSARPRVMVNARIAPMKAMIGKGIVPAEPMATPRRTAQAAPSAAPEETPVM